SRNRTSTFLRRAGGRPRVLLPDETAEPVAPAWGVPGGFHTVHGGGPEGLPGAPGGVHVLVHAHGQRGPVGGGLGGVPGGEGVELEHAVGGRGEQDGGRGVRARRDDPADLARPRHRARPLGPGAPASTTHSGGGGDERADDAV